MDIFEVLESDHAYVRNLLNEIILRTSLPKPKRDRFLRGENWEHAFHDLKLAMIAHDRAEEATLYDHIRLVAHQSDLAESKADEHHYAELLLNELEHGDPKDRDWDARLGLLKNQLESHQADEETATFDMLRAHIDPETSARLAREFIQLHDEIIEGSPYQRRVGSTQAARGLSLGH